MRTASFSVYCQACYKVNDFPIPDEFFKDGKVNEDELCEYLRDKLYTMSVEPGSLEWIADNDDEPISHAIIYNPETDTEEDVWFI